MTLAGDILLVTLRNSKRTQEKKNLTTPSMETLLPPKLSEKPFNCIKDESLIILPQSCLKSQSWISLLPQERKDTGYIYSAFALCTFGGPLIKIYIVVMDKYFFFCTSALSLSRQTNCTVLYFENFNQYKILRSHLYKSL